LGYGGKEKMHTVKVNIIADQYIEIHPGTEINIHDLTSIVLNSNGKVIEWGLKNTLLGFPITYKDEDLIAYTSEYRKEWKGEFIYKEKDK